MVIEFLKIKFSRKEKDVCVGEIIEVPLLPSPFSHTEEEIAKEAALAQELVGKVVHFSDSNVTRTKTEDIFYVHYNKIFSIMDTDQDAILDVGQELIVDSEKAPAEARRQHEFLLSKNQTRATISVIDNKDGTSTITRVQ
jgi:hypothetical protein